MMRVLQVIVCTAALLKAGAAFPQSLISDAPPGESVQFRPRLVAVDNVEARLFHVIWEDHRGPTWTIRHQLISETGALIGVNRVVSDTSLGSAMDPDIAANDTCVVIVWRAAGGTGERVAFQRLDALTGDLDGSAVNLSDGILTEYVGRPSVCIDPATGEAYAAWTQADGSWDQVFVSSDCGDAAQITFERDTAMPGHYEDAKIAFEGSEQLTVAYSFQQVPEARRLMVQRLNATCHLSASTAETVDDDHTMSFPVDVMLDHELLSFSEGSDCATVLVWSDATSAQPLVTRLRSSWSINGADFSVAGEVAVDSDPLSIHAGLSLARSDSATIMLTSGRLDLIDGVGKVDANALDFNFGTTSATWQVEQNLSDALCMSTGCPTWPDKGKLFPLPRPSVASDGAGGAVAVWMQAQPGNQNYDYLAWAKKPAEDPNWSTAQPLTTPGNAMTPPGSEGTARTGFPQAAHAGGSMVLFAWDERRNWTIPDPPDCLDPTQPPPPRPGPRGAPDIYTQVVTL